MDKYEVVFVLLNYNTSKDLEYFIKSTDKLTLGFKYKILCVDNYSNDINLERLSKLKRKYNFDILKNENTGYGDGNNKGIEFALKHYEFDFLIVSNCDIEIEKFSIDVLQRKSDGIIVPNIINNAGAFQNPMYYKKHNILFWMFNQASKLSSTLLQKLTIGFSKLLKIRDRLLINDNKIFAGHGSFIIFPHIIITRLHPIFEKEMFLLCEELVLAVKADKDNIPIYYCDDIKVKHFEDASMGNYNNQNKKFKLWQQSYSIFYKKYAKSKNNFIN